MLENFNENIIFCSLRAGAKGFVPKNISAFELIEAIEVVSTGREYFSSTVFDIILKSYTDKAKNGLKVNDEAERILSAREIEILKQIRDGFSNQEISEKVLTSSLQCAHLHYIHSHPYLFPHHDPRVYHHL